MKRWSSMQDRVESYLKARRRVGYLLRIEGAQLLRFARFADQRHHHGHITIDLAVTWANDSQKSHQIGRARRLEVVRSLAKYCVIFETETEIPPTHLLGPAHRRPNPHIYSDHEIASLLDMANQLQPKQGLRPVTMHYLLGLLASTGIRISEALRLARDDVDLHKGILQIRKSKFRKSRDVPVHQMVCDELARYAALRDQRLSLVQNRSFFLLDDGSALCYRQVEYSFHSILVRLGWESCPNDRHLRLYDLRHTFVCRRLLAWYEEGVDVDRMMPVLSTYLGHAKVTDTYWYLTGIPALMKIVAARFEHQSQLNLLRGES